MITGIHISQEIFAIDVLTALKSSLEQRRHHVLRLLRLYEDQALVVFPLLAFKFDYLVLCGHMLWLIDYMHRQESDPSRFLVAALGFHNLFSWVYDDSKEDVTSRAESQKTEKRFKFLSL